MVNINGPNFGVGTCEQGFILKIEGKLVFVSLSARFSVRGSLIQKSNIKVKLEKRVDRSLNFIIIVSFVGLMQ